MLITFNLSLSLYFFIIILQKRDKTVAPWVLQIFCMFLDIIQFEHILLKF